MKSKPSVIPAKAGIHKAQSTIEFTFAMIVIIFLIYGMVAVFHWAGMDLANRRVAQDSSLTAPVLSTDAYPASANYPYGGNPAVQLESEAGNSVLPMAAVYHGEVANGNISQ